jgi:thiamine biosynthesis lipoprotein
VAHIVADTGAHLDLAASLLEELESRWSRFRLGSDVDRLNRAAGAPCTVHPDTIDLIERARAAWRATGGLYDPTVYDALVDAGYDRSFDLIEAADDRAPPPADPRPTSPTPGAGGLEIDHRASTVRLPLGVHLDLGGIGKGRAADLVADALVTAGSEHVLVNLGGDLRVVGGHPDGGPWGIGVEDPLDAARTVVTLALDDGAVATSTTARRRWTQGGRARHHLIDPRTGEPVATSLVAVTAVCPEAIDADVLAKVALIADRELAIEMLNARGVPALLVDDHGRWSATGAIEGYLVPEGVDVRDEEPSLLGEVSV